MNSTDTLRAHLKRLKDEVEATPDAGRLRAEWIADLGALMDTLHGWLREAEREGLLKIERGETDIDEARYGAYEAPAMTITAPDGRELLVQPMGLNVLGFQGRVDLECGPRRARLMRGADRAWKLGPATQRSHSMFELVPLDEQAFADVLDDLLGLSDPSVE